MKPKIHRSQTTLFQKSFPPTPFTTSPYCRSHSYSSNKAHFKTYDSTGNLELHLSRTKTSVQKKDQNAISLQEFKRFKKGKKSILIRNKLEASYQGSNFLTNSKTLAKPKRVPALRRSKSGQIPGTTLEQFKIDESKVRSDTKRLKELKIQKLTKLMLFHRISTGHKLRKIESNFNKGPGFMSQFSINGTQRRESYLTKLFQSGQYENKQRKPLQSDYWISKKASGSRKVVLMKKIV